MFEFDGTLIVLAFSFIIFIWIMQSIFYSPMTQVKHERKDYIEQNKALADKAANEGELINKLKEQKLTEARKNATDSVSKVTENANLRRVEIVKGARNTAREELEQHKELMNQEKEQAIEQLKGSVLELAHCISAKVLGKEVPMSGISHDVIEKALNLDNTGKQKGY